MIVEQALGDMNQAIASNVTPSRGLLDANEARSMLLRMMSLKRDARRCNAAAVSGKAGQSFTD
jgi:hypothetical protein